MSAFSFIGVDGMDGTSFQGLPVEGENPKKKETSMASLKDAQKVVQEGGATSWGQLVKLPENKCKEGLGFSPSKLGVIKPTEGRFHSAGFIHASPEANAFVEDKYEEVAPSFVIPGGVCRNWVVVDVPSVTHLSK